MVRDVKDMAQKGHLSNKKPLLLTRSKDDTTRVADELRKRMRPDGVSTRKKKPDVPLAPPLLWKAKK